MDGRRDFPSTNWSMIRQCQAPDSRDYRVSLNALFGRYWSPVCAYLRRSFARSDEEARDLTQEFFLTFLQKDFIESVSAEKGRFRAFVKVAVKNFALNQKRAARALKRAPRDGLLSLDQLEIEVPGPQAADPEAAFEEEWRKSAVRAALAALRVRYEASGKLDRIALLEAYDMAPDPQSRPTYEALAGRFDLSVSQVRNRLRFARKELTEQLQQEIRDQVASEADYRKEAQELFGLDG